MNIMRGIKKFFSPVTVQDDCEYRIHEATSIIKSCNEKIVALQYQVTMAQAQLAAAKRYKETHYESH